MPIRLLIGLVIFLLPVLSHAQSGNQRCRWVKSSAESFSLDSLSAYPSSVKIAWPSDSTVKVEYDVNTGKAKLQSSRQTDSVLICYTVLPFSLHQPYYKRNPAQYDSTGKIYREVYRPYKGGLPDKREEIFSSPGMQKTGTISRGVSFGNTQNLFVNSVLNLQLEGKLTDDLSMTAVISDQNIPFQPQGNTQQLYEFDKVYIQLKSKRMTFTVGDVVLQHTQSYFLKYYRNIQGGRIEYKSSTDSLYKGTTYAGFGVSKGKFNSMLLGYGGTDSLYEGVQGPYRLHGPNGERYITVIANSEKVYLDGVLLQRGFDYGYVIDYNTGEITFTNRVMITRYSRVRINFEYTERNYSRAIYTAGHFQEIKRVDLYVNYYEEKDNPNNPLTFDLSQSDRDSLQEAGDSVNQAYSSGATEVVFSNELILYATSVVGTETVYTYSTDPTVAVWQVKFSQVPQGQGNYVLANTTVNGRVYNYVGPGLGNYVPYVIIPAPRRKSMITTGGGYNIKGVGRVGVESAFSNNDLNMLSTEDSEDDKGVSYRISYLNKGQPIKKWEGYKWISGLSYEYNAVNFSPVDRFRDNPDFERDWNENTTVRASNTLIQGSVGVTKNTLNTLSYRVTRRLKPGDVDGYQQDLILNKKIKNFQWLGSGFMMKNTKPTSQAEWLRYSGHLYYRAKWITPGISYSADRNKVLMGDSLITTTMNFEETRFYIKNSDSTRFKYSAEQSYRNDYEAYQGQLSPNSRATTSILTFSGKPAQNHDLSGTATLRNLNNNIGPTPLPKEQNLLSRIDWNASMFKKHMRSELTIIGGTGRTLQRQFNYQLVPTGQGNYVWNDFNGDNIKDLTEFVPKIYDDPNGEYIKVFLPTDTYIKSFQNNFNYRLDASAPRKWRNDTVDFKRFISKFSNVTSWNVVKNITDPDVWKRFVPFVSHIDSANLITYQNAIRTTLFFNRTNPTYGMDAGYFMNDNKQFLTQGYESVSNRDIFFNTRVNIKSVYNTKLKLSRLHQTNRSNFLMDRNYEIVSYEASPELAWQPRNTMRITFTAGAKFKQNIYSVGKGERADFYTSSLEFKLNKVSRRTFTGNVKYIHIIANLNGTAIGSPIGYQMFEALKPGNNYTWNLTWQEKLVNGLQLSFSYEGRKSETSKWVHIGRMQVSALF